MAPPSAQPGQAPLDANAQSALAQALQKTGPPNNPQTQVQRTDPQYKWLGMLHGIRKACDMTIAEALDDRGPEEQVLITSVRHAIDRLINGVQGPQASLKLASEVTQAFAPEIAQQADAQLMQMTAPPTVAGGPQLAGPGGIAGPQQPPVPPGMPPGGMQPPVPPAMAGISAG